MISWLMTNSIAPAAAARPQGSNPVARLTSAAPNTAPTGSTRPEAMPRPTDTSLL